MMSAEAPTIHDDKGDIWLKGESDDEAYEALGDSNR